MVKGTGYFLPRRRSYEEFASGKLPPSLVAQDPGSLVAGRRTSDGPHVQHKYAASAGNCISRRTHVNGVGGSCGGNANGGSNLSVASANSQPHMSQARHVKGQRQLTCIGSRHDTSPVSSHCSAGSAAARIQPPPPPQRSPAASSTKPINMASNSSMRPSAAASPAEFRSGPFSSGNCSVPMLHAAPVGQVFPANVDKLNPAHGWEEVPCACSSDSGPNGSRSSSSSLSGSLQLTEPSILAMPAAAADAGVSDSLYVTYCNGNFSADNSAISWPLPLATTATGSAPVAVADPLAAFGGPAVSGNSPSSSSLFGSSSLTDWSPAAAASLDSPMDEEVWPGLFVPSTSDSIVPVLGPSSLLQQHQLTEAQLSLESDDCPVPAVGPDMHTLMNLRHKLAEARLSATGSAAIQPDTGISNSSSFSMFDVPSHDPLAEAMSLSGTFQQQVQSGGLSVAAAASLGYKPVSAWSSPDATAQLSPGINGTGSVAVAVAAHKLQQLLAAQRLQQQLQQEVLSLLPLI